MTLKAMAGALVLSLMPALPGHAFEIRHRETRYADRQYRCELTLKLDAPIERVEAVLRDYEGYPALDTRILKAKILERPAENVAVLETTVRACFGPFCRNVRRVERVEESPHALAAIADAGRSDVRFGETYMTLSVAEDGGTEVSYSTRVVPKFWVPIIGGRRWLLNTLENATSDLFMNVEIKAKEAEESG